MALAAVYLLRARLRLDQGQARHWAQRLTALAGSPAGDGWPALRSFALANLGATLLWSGSVADGHHHLREALALACECRCEQLELDCQAQLAMVALFDGCLSKAEQAAGEAFELIERGGCEEGEAAACAYLAAGSVAFWRGEMEHAEGLASQAVNAAQSATLAVRLTARALHALACAASGPRSASAAMIGLSAARAALASGTDVPRFVILALEDAEARVALAAGEVAAARALIARTHAQREWCPTLQVREAEAALQAGESAQTRGLLAGVLEHSDLDYPTIGPRDAVQLEALLLLALAEQDDGEHDAAATKLERALELAEQERICGPFLTRDRATRQLLERQAQLGTEHPALLEILLGDLGRVSGDGEARPLPVPLTERELRILRYLPTMLSNAEIGAEAFVSLNTVKTHLRSIYRKLDAGNRADAVQRAARAWPAPARDQAAACR